MLRNPKEFWISGHNFRYNAMATMIWNWRLDNKPQYFCSLKWRWNWRIGVENKSDKYHPHLLMLMWVITLQSLCNLKSWWIHKHIFYNTITHCISQLVSVLWLVNFSGPYFTIQPTKLKNLLQLKSFERWDTVNI